MKRQLFFFLLMATSLPLGASQPQEDIRRSHIAKKRLIYSASIAAATEIGSSGYLLCADRTLSPHEKKLHLIRLAQGCITLKLLFDFSQDPTAHAQPNILTYCHMGGFLTSALLDVSLFLLPSHDYTSFYRSLIATSGATLSGLNTLTMLPPHLRPDRNMTLGSLTLIWETCSRIITSTPRPQPPQNTSLPVDTPPAAAGAGASTIHGLTFQQIFNARHTSSPLLFEQALRGNIPATTTQNPSKTCDICLSEKLFIIYLDSDNTHNPIQPICAECLCNCYRLDRGRNPYTRQPLETNFNKWTQWH